MSGTCLKHILQARSRPDCQTEFKTRNLILRPLIISLGLILTAGCQHSDNSPASPAKKAIKIILKMAHNGNEKHPFQKGFEEFKRNLEADTEKAAEVQIFPNAQLGSEQEATQMVKLGLIAASASTTAGGLSTSVPEAELFNLPFIFRDIDHCYRVIDGPIGQGLARVIEQKLHCLVLGYWFSGIRNVWNSKRPVRVPADLKGIKIRVMASPLLIETFNTLGAQATPMAFGELYSALQTRVVDGGETDYLDLLYERFYEVTRYVSLTQHMYVVTALIFSRKIYDKLPGDVQTAVLKAGRASVAAEREAMDTLSASARQELQTRGLQFVEVERELFRARVQSVYENNADRVGGLTLIEKVINY
jgi:tripartite ATP-independent transporter DctP family solute receptor